jgi:hypothetical protein
MRRARPLPRGRAFFLGETCSASGLRMLHAGASDSAGGVSLPESSDSSLAGCLPALTRSGHDFVLSVRVPETKSASERPGLPASNAGGASDGRWLAGPQHGRCFLAGLPIDPGKGFEIQNGSMDRHWNQTELLERSGLPTPNTIRADSLTTRRLHIAIEARDRTPSINRIRGDGS